MAKGPAWLSLGTAILVTLVAGMILYTELVREELRAILWLFAFGFVFAIAMFVSEIRKRLR